MAGLLKKRGGLLLVAVVALGAGLSLASRFSAAPRFLFRPKGQPEATGVQFLWRAKVEEPVAFGDGRYGMTTNDVLVLKVLVNHLEAWALRSQGSAPSPRRMVMYGDWLCRQQGGTQDGVIVACPVLSASDGNGVWLGVGIDIGSLRWGKSGAGRKVSGGAFAVPMPPGATPAVVYKTPTEISADINVQLTTRGFQELKPGAGLKRYR